MTAIPTSGPIVATTLAPLRVMQLINALAANGGDLTLAQLSAQMDVPKSSLLSLLRTLGSRGYVEAADGSYRLGQESFALAALISRSRPFPDNVRPLLGQLHRQCGETVLIAVHSDSWSEVVYVDLIESAHSLRFKVQVGSRDPLYCTALGLAMLAFAPEAARKHYLASVQLTRRTEGTLTSKAQLQRFLTQVHGTALAVSSGINLNVTAIAAPVFGADGCVMAAVALAGLSADVLRREARLSELIRRSASAMSQRQGCRGYPPPGT